MSTLSVFRDARGALVTIFSWGAIEEQLSHLVKKNDIGKPIRLSGLDKVR